MAKKPEKLRNIHPGEILKTEFLDPLKLSQNKIARDLDVPPRRINEVVLGKRAITLETGILLDKYFNMSEGFFAGLQFDYEMRKAKEKLQDKLATITAYAHNEESSYV